MRQQPIEDLFDLKLDNQGSCTGWSSPARVAPQSDDVEGGAAGRVAVVAQRGHHPALVLLGHRRRCYVRVHVSPRSFHVGIRLFAHRARELAGLLHLLCAGATCM